MSGSQTERVSARERQERDERRQRRIVFVGVGVLLVATFVALIGVFFTQYLPPRARVLSIEGESVSASELVARAMLLAVFEPNVPPPPGIDQFPAFTLEKIIDEEALRFAAADELGFPTAEQHAAESRALLQIPADADEVAFAGTLTKALSVVGLSRAAFDAVVEARIQEAAVRATIREDLTDSAVQLRLRRIRVADEARAHELREQALAGADFSELADEASLDAIAEPGGDLGWLIMEQIDHAIAAVVNGFEPGDITEPLPVGFFFELYLLEERDEERLLEEDQVMELVRVGMEEWLAAARGAIAFESDLSAGESQWVFHRLQNRLSDGLQNR